jgi:hypothetical protein
MTGNGLISGTPQIGGTFQSWLAVKNQCPGDSSERLFTFYVVDPAPLVINTPELKPAARGVAYQAELLSSEAGVLTWTLNAGQLPVGLKLSKDGMISGTPAAGGSYTFRAKVNDGRRTATKEFMLIVTPRLGFATKHLPRASVGHVLRTRIVAQGGVAPLRVTIVRGALPRGVRFAAGLLSGKPRVAGTFRFTVKVTDAHSLSSTRTFVLTVRR